jgi:hypothetical protein
VPECVYENLNLSRPDPPWRGTATFTWGYSEPLSNMIAYMLKDAARK